MNRSEYFERRAICQLPVLSIFPRASPHSLPPPSYSFSSFTDQLTFSIHLDLSSYRAIEKQGLLRWLSGKESTCNAGDMGLIPGSGRSWGWEDPLEKDMATHSRILTWQMPWTEEPGGLQPMGLKRVWCWHDWATKQQSVSDWLGSASY